MVYPSVKPSLLPQASCSLSVGGGIGGVGGVGGGGGNGGGVDFCSGGIKWLFEREVVVVLCQGVEKSWW
jgi:hypothetical protein